MRRFLAVIFAMSLALSFASMGNSANALPCDPGYGDEGC